MFYQWCPNVLGGVCWSVKQMEFYTAMVVFEKHELSSLPLDQTDAVRFFQHPQRFMQFVVEDHLSRFCGIAIWSFHQMSVKRQVLENLVGYWTFIILLCK